RWRDSVQRVLWRTVRQMCPHQIEEGEQRFVAVLAAMIGHVVNHIADRGFGVALVIDVARPDRCQQGMKRNAEQPVIMGELVADGTGETLPADRRRLRQPKASGLQWTVGRCACVVVEVIKAALKAGIQHTDQWIVTESYGVITGRL